MTKGVGESYGVPKSADTCVVCSQKKEEQPSVTLTKCSHIYHLTCLQFAQPLEQECDNCRNMFRYPPNVTSKKDLEVISVPSGNFLRKLYYPKMELFEESLRGMPSLRMDKVVLTKEIRDAETRRRLQEILGDDLYSELFPPKKMPKIDPVD